MKDGIGVAWEMTKVVNKKQAPENPPYFRLNRACISDLIFITPGDRPVSRLCRYAAAEIY